MKENYEALRDAPNGKEIALLSQRTELTEEDKWVKVTVTGWIKKQSAVTDLTDIKEEIVDDTTPAGKGFTYGNVSLR